MNARDAALAVARRNPAAAATLADRLRNALVPVSVVAGFVDDREDADALRDAVDAIVELADALAPHEATR